MKLVDLVGIHLEATSGAPLVLLREHDAPHRVLPIFVGGAEAASIAMALSGHVAPRPLTHDVMASLVEHLSANIDAVEVTELRDGAFFAAISVSGPGGGHRLDSRPSDAIALAARFGCPLFVSDDVLARAGTVMPEAEDEDIDEQWLDDEAIDAAVIEFRELLDQLDPADLVGATGADEAETAGAGADDTEPDEADEAETAGAGADDTGNDTGSPDDEI